MIRRAALVLWPLTLALLGCAKAPPAAVPIPTVVATAQTQPATPAATVLPEAATPPQPPPPRSKSVQEQLQQAIDEVLGWPGVGRGTWGIIAQSLTSGDRLFEHNPRTLLVPASIAKLVSLAAAVDAVGWDYRFETTLRATGPVVEGVLQGDLIVVGSGDPAIGGRAGDDFTGWVEAVKAAGIRRIQGRIIGDDDAIDDPRPGAMWAWDDLGYTTGVLFGALNYGENRMVVTVAPTIAAGGSVSITVDPQAATRPLNSRARTGERGSPQLLWPEQRPGELSLTIAGSIPVDAPPVRMSVSAGNPTFWFVSVLRDSLIRAGVEVAGGAFDVDDLPAPPDRESARVLYAYHSRPLSEIAQPLLKESINLYGEAVLRLSTGAGGGRTNDDALQAIGQRLALWGLPTDTLQIVDGSGLSRRDAASAEAFIAVLHRFYDGMGASPWMTGMPVAGQDGTLEGRLKGTPAERNVRAKTGTMSNVRSLAGYLRTRDGEPLAFAIMVNNFEGTGAQATAAIDAIAVRLASFSRSQ